MDLSAALAVYLATFIATFRGQNYKFDGQDIETYVKTFSEQNQTIVTWRDYSTFRKDFTDTFKKQNPTITEQDIKAFTAAYVAGEFRDQADDLKCVHFTIY
jgi:hypothetical protein